MTYIQNGNRFELHDGHMTVWIESWGHSALRVRVTALPRMDKNDWALDTQPACQPAVIQIQTKKVMEPWYAHYPESEKHEREITEAVVTNENISAHINGEGWISFTDNKGNVLLEEYWRNRNRIDRYAVPLNIAAREVKPKAGTGDFEITQRFEAYDGEKLFGMGQYQDSHLDKKGCVLELAQRNTQATVPFVVSNRGYGFLWNSPSVGSASFAANLTTWTGMNSPKIDYWITAGNPEEIERNYADVTGHAPMMPDYAMGFWQCKLRYRTQDEVLRVAHEYRHRGIPLSVIVIDFFHWTKQGDFKFDPRDWPDPEAMVKELTSMGVKLMVSVWPTADEKSENYSEMMEQGLLITFDRGVGVNMTWMGNTTFIDVTNPQARSYIWEKCKKNYFQKGISLFWLDEAEPEFGIYDFDQYRYSIGSAAAVSNIYPRCYAQGFYEALKKEGIENPINLVRCAWAGSQKYGALAWSGDVHSDFRTLRIQLQAGLSMAMAGIPWWTTDIGGFIGGDVLDPHFRELLVRWFEWGVFCPVLRLHGERPPFNPLPDRDGSPQMPSGQDNEVWSFGDDIYTILTNLIALRAKLKPYITAVMKDTHENGAPVMRPLFYQFPADTECWECTDEYLFGPDLLVAPVMTDGTRARDVYLPKGSHWTDSATGAEYDGGRTVTVDAPLGRIPVFTRGPFDIPLWTD